MRYFYSAMIVLLSLSMQNCKSTDNKVASLDGLNGSFKTLSGNITTKDIRDHDAALQSQGTMPAGGM